jgi:hypothetical protein
VWISIQQPFELGNGYNTWMLISPQEVRLSSLQCKAGQVNLKVGIKSYIETYTGAKPSVNVNSALPKLLTDNTLADNFQIGLIGEISYATATEMLKKEVLNQLYTFEDNKYQMTIKDLDLQGSADKLLIRMDVEGKVKKGARKNIKGRIYMQGIPYYDAASQSIKIRDFDYDVRTKNALVKTAGWVAKIGFAAKIRDMLDFPLKDKMAEALKMLQDGLNANNRIGDNILLKGNISKLEPQGIYLTPTSIKAVVNAEGKVNVSLDKF